MTKKQVAALHRAVQIAGGLSALADKLKIRPQKLHYRIYKAKRIRVPFALEIEAAVDKQVTRYEIRPDVFRS